MNLLEGLNEKQKEVVQTTEGPLLVLAGAGSGKTKALTHRIAYLISENKVPPSSILAITFTNKAASEMGARIKKLLASSKELPAMGTFHSVCARILRSEGGFVGYTPGFAIYDEDDSLKMIKLCLKKLKINDEKLSPKAIKNHISSAKNELIEPVKYTEIISGPKSTEIALVYGAYQKELQKNDAMDFDDLILNVVHVFRQQPAVLEKYQRIWRYLLIDEYQDTNQAQYVFAKLLAAQNQNICVVGDDWQSIYSWRGANFMNILNFKRDWPKAKTIKLEQNYRSTKAIIAAAQSVIENNRQRSEKVLYTGNQEGSPLGVYEARGEDDEGGFVCREILNLASSGFRLRDISVFYRTNAQSRVLEEQLLRYRIPYKIIGGVRFYERKEIKDVISWLRMAAGHGDFVSFERSLGAPASGIGAKTIEKIKQYIDENNLYLKDIANTKEISNLISLRMRLLLDEYFQKITKIRTAAKNSVKDAIEAAIGVTGIRDSLDDGSFQNEERLENLKELLSVAEEYSRVRKEFLLTDFLEEIALISDVDNYQEEAEGVTLMTVHTSKGLEFKVVFLVGLEENIFPHARSQLDPMSLEEERRLFYVALTRAREKLYLIYSSRRLYFGSIQNNLPSRFIAEIPPPLLTYLNISGIQVKNPEIKETNVNLQNEFLPGDMIEHEHFGRGTVKKINEDELTVFFPEEGEKVISIYYAPIKKVKSV